MGYGRLSLAMRLQHLLAEKSVTGACMAHVRKDAIEVAAAGMRNKDTAEPVDASTVFGAASLTKPIVSYALLQLVDAGVLDLDEPLSRWTQPIVPAVSANRRRARKHAGAAQLRAGATGHTHAMPAARCRRHGGMRV